MSSKVNSQDLTVDETGDLPPSHHRLDKLAWVTAVTIKPDPFLAIRAKAGCGVTTIKV